MLRILLHFVLNILVILGLSALLPSFQVGGAWQAAFFLVILTLLNWTVLPIIKFFTLPINFLTLGLFNLILNLLVIIIVANSTRGVELSGSFVTQLITALFITVCLSVANGFINSIEKI